MASVIHSAAPAGKMNTSTVCSPSGGVWSLTQLPAEAGRKIRDYISAVGLVSIPSGVPSLRPMQTKTLTPRFRSYPFDSFR